MDTLHLKPMPDSLLQLITNGSKRKRRRRGSPGNPLAGVNQGSRNDVVFKYACSVIKTGISRHEIEELVKIKANNCRPPLEQREVDSIVNSAMSYKAEVAIPESIDAHALFDMDISVPEMVIPGILPTGVTVFAGKPKSGKSWFGLDLALAVASGSSIMNKVIDQGSVVYFALEDTDARLQQRMNILVDEAPPEGSLSIYTDWVSGDVDSLKSKLNEQPDIKLVIIDTLERFRAKTTNNNNVYGKDYQDIGELKKIADDLGTAILIIHHTRKSESDDIFQTVSGTLGITGAADSTWVLDSDQNDSLATLHVQGRDIERQSITLEFNNGKWEHYGNYENKPNRLEREILARLKDGVTTPMEIADAICKDPGHVSKSMQRMREKGMISRVSHGSYSLVS